MTSLSSLAGGAVAEGQNDNVHCRRSDVPRHAIVLRHQPSIVMLAIAFVASVAYAPQCSKLGDGRGHSKEPRRHRRRRCCRSPAAAAAEV